MNWTSRNHHKDPTVNALLNIAEQLSECAAATNGLLYGLKYSKGEGMSVAEALEISIKEAGSGIAEAVREGSQSIADAMPLPEKR